MRSGYLDRLDRAEVDRLIQRGYQLHSKYGLMVKTLFFTGARVEEFVHLRQQVKIAWTFS